MKAGVWKWEGSVVSQTRRVGALEVASLKIPERKGGP